MKKSFTLIELIVVIAIIAILAAIIAPNAFRAIKKAQIAKVVADMKTIKTALLSFYSDTGKFTGAHYFKIGGTVILESGDSCSPCLHLNTTPLMANEANVSGWDGPYVDKVLRSPISHKHVSPGYTYPGRYFIGGSGRCYTQSFDLDGNGNIDILQAVSIHLPGLEKADAWAIDNIFDNGSEEIELNPGEFERRGVMNVESGWAGEYYVVYLYVGTGGPPGGICD